MQDNTLRIFAVGEGNLTYGMKVEAVCGEGRDMRSVPCEFNGRGLITNLPRSANWGEVKSREDFDRRRNKLVRRFHLEPVHGADAGIVVAQRGQQNRYRAAPGMSLLQGELVSHSLPPLGVTHWFRSAEEQEKFGLGPTAVWTDPMSKKFGGPNRVDVWFIGLNGSVNLHCAYLVTLDDGVTFRLVGQDRWVGDVYRRKPGTKHVLRSEDKRVAEVYNRSSEVRDMLDRYVFVPGDHSENFEARMQILENPAFRQAVEAANVEVWDGDDNFWFERNPGTDLREDQGVVKFLTYGVGRGSFGILNWKGSPYQFDHRSIVGAAELADEQGIVFLAPGTVVDIGAEPVRAIAGNNFNPPKIAKITPRLVPVPIEPVAP